MPNGLPPPPLTRSPSPSITHEIFNFVGPDWGGIPHPGPLTLSLQRDHPSEEGNFGAESKNRVMPGFLSQILAFQEKI